jgi:hypothetical protein
MAGFSRIFMSRCNPPNPFEIGTEPVAMCKHEHEHEHDYEHDYEHEQ